MATNTTPELDQAIKIVQSEQFTRENYQALVALADKAGDRSIGDMVEAFIAAAPDTAFLEENENAAS